MTVHSFPHSHRRLGGGAPLAEPAVWSSRVRRRRAPLLIRPSWVSALVAGEVPDADAVRTIDQGGPRLSGERRAA